MKRSISLLYHDVVLPSQYAVSGFQSPDADLYKLDKPQFVAHLDAIAARGGGGNRLFTFDDGGASALRTAELLSQRGWRGIFFVPTNFIGTTGFLDASGIQELARGGHTIGSHSCSHPLRMAALPPWLGGPVPVRLRGQTGQAVLALGDLMWRDKDGAAGLRFEFGDTEERDQWTVLLIDALLARYALA